MTLIALTKTHAPKLATGSLLMVGSAGAFAADTGGTAAAAAFTALQSQVSEFAGYAWPVVAATVGALVAISLFKKFASKAS